MNPETIAVAALRDLSQSHALTQQQLSSATNLQAQASRAPSANPNMAARSHKKGCAAVSNVASPTMSPAEAPKKHKQQIVKFPIEPTIIQIIKKPRTFMNHSYRDFSKVPAEANEVVPTDISAMTFPQKVHHILSQDEYVRCICKFDQVIQLHVLGV